MWKDKPKPKNYNNISILHKDCGTIFVQTKEEVPEYFFCAQCKKIWPYGNILYDDWVLDCHVIDHIPAVLSSVMHKDCGSGISPILFDVAQRVYICLICGKKWKRLPRQEMKNKLYYHVDAVRMKRIGTFEMGERGEG